MNGASIYFVLFLFCFEASPRELYAGFPLVCLFVCSGVVMIYSVYGTGL